MQENTQNLKASTKRKCINLCAADKLAILNRLSAGESIKALAIESNVTEKTIQYWLENRDSIEKLNMNGGILQKKRFRKVPFKKLDNAVYVWYYEMRLRGLPISGPIVKKKAIELHAEMKIQEKFCASEGWLRNWKARYNIRQIQITGEKMSADPKAAEDFKNKFPSIMEGKNLTLPQIFSFDEFGIFFRMLPSRTLTEAQMRQAPGFKGSKDRYTVGVCANVDGSCKLPLVMIGKSKSPRTLKHLPRSAFSIYYREKSAYMNSDIFKTWFQEQFVPNVKNFLYERGLPHRALLLLDNILCHPDNETLKVGEIEVLFLSANTTNVLQLMHQGIIASTKRKYRFKLLKAALANQEKQIDVITFLKSINVRNVIHWMGEAWNEVSSHTILKCWKLLLLSPKIVEYQDLNSTADDNVGVRDIKILLNKLKDYEKVSEEVVKDWIHKDDNKFCQMPTNVQIIEMISKEEDETTEEGSNTEKKNTPLFIVNPEQAVSAASTLLSFFEQNGDIGISTSELAAIKRVKEIILTNFGSEKACD